MEIMLRCELNDEPGTLAALTGAIGEAGGDIQAVDVVETAGGRVLDDLVVVIGDSGGGRLFERIHHLDGVDLVHAGPSRGHPGDAVTRLAVGLEALLTGHAERDRGVLTLIGGLLRATEAELVAHHEAPCESSRVLVLPMDKRAMVLRRDYRFTRTERDRAASLLRLCLLAAPAPAAEA